MRRVAVFAAWAVLAAGCGGAGDGGALPPGAATTAAPPAPAPGRTSADEVTTGDGNRYRVTLTLGDHPVPADACPAPTPGGAGPGVTVTVTNLSADRTAPFLPLRVELVGDTGGSPRPVPVGEPGGDCDFTPRPAPIPAGASVVLRGTAPDGSGRVEVAVSETRFSLAAPVG